ncbi:MAG: carbonate dehydratase [Opitutia bacterium]|jgi:carbonic anhydrase
MPLIAKLFDQNRAWSEDMRRSQPGFFETLSRQQSPKYLWIGCSDSRVPANEIVGLLPGELFVHRNVANVVVHSDLNCLSVIQYAVETLKVEHIIVCGHYGCGGVQAALENRRLGLIDNWLRHIRDVHHKHALSVESVLGPAKLDTLCELNVVEQALHVCQTSIVQDAWARGAKLGVHAWIYGLTDGQVKDLGLNVKRAEDLTPAYGQVLARYRAA